MTNEITKTQPKFSVVIHSDMMKNLINKTLGDEKRAQRFVASICSAVATNPQLQSCEPQSIISSALLGESLNLSPSPQLGRFYLVPFKDKQRGDLAQFILGYKGYLELAQRSGQYKDINVIEIREGEYKGRNKQTGVPQFEFIEDDDIRENKEIIGYMASFTLLNGFTKTIYWSKEKMEKHALQYSSGYRADKKNKTEYTFWSKDFTGQAFKTMLRQLISKWAIMSIDMQQAYENDMAVIHSDGTKEYIDNQEEPEIFEPKETNNIKETEEPETKSLNDVE